MINKFFRVIYKILTYHYFNDIFKYYIFTSKASFRCSKLLFFEKFFSKASFVPIFSKACFVPIQK